MYPCPRSPRGPNPRGVESDRPPWCRGTLDGVSPAALQSVSRQVVALEESPCILMKQPCVPLKGELGHVIDVRSYDQACARHAPRRCHIRLRHSHATNCIFSRAICPEMGHTCRPGMPKTRRASRGSILGEKNFSVMPNSSCTLCGP